MLTRLRDQLWIERLLVEGGSGINGALLRGFVDEISLLLAHAVDGRRDVPAVFDYDISGGGTPAATAIQASLLSCTQRVGGLVWLRYDVTRAAPGDNHAA